VARLIVALKPRELEAQSTELQPEKVSNYKAGENSRETVW
jgi:hypothetical protein